MAFEYNHDVENPALEGNVSLPQPSNPLESFLASWPVKICLKCATMTGTLEGLQALMSKEGYSHFGRPGLRESAENGCMFCKFLFDIAEPDLWVEHWPWDRVPEDFSDISEYSESAEESEASIKQDMHRRETKPMITVSCYFEDVFTSADGVPKKVNLRRLKIGLRAEIIPASYYDVDSMKFYGYTDKYSNSVVIDGHQVEFSFDQLVIPFSFADRVVLEAMRQRLRDCDLNHNSTCPFNGARPLPSRVVDVEADGNAQGLNLHITSPGEAGQYTALSYCWGEPPYTFTSTKSMLEDPAKIDWKNLPATLTDAVAVTRSLGIKYLWIDAICIAQDDDTDKIKEIKDMGKIYKNARVTIAAASAKSVHDGFLPRNVRDDVPLPILLQEGGYDTFWVRKNLPKKVPDEPLDSRGWALQEYLLSPRVLYYGSRDLFWKCQQDLFVSVVPTQEAYSTDNFSQTRVRLPATIFDIASDHVTNVDLFWIWVQAAYSVRNLRLFEDRFRALGGIAEFIQRASGDVYLAGLWKSSLVQQLAWEHERNHEFETENKEMGPPSNPSWSWLSRFYPVRTMSIDAAPDPLKPELLSWSIHLADESSPFGHVLGGELNLMATVTHSLEITRVAPDVVNLAVKVNLDSRIPSELSHGLSIDRFISESYYYLYIGDASHRHSFGLLLLSVGDSTFTRQGLINVSSREAKTLVWMSDNAQRMKVTLV